MARFQITASPSKMYPVAGGFVCDWTVTVVTKTGQKFTAVNTNRYRAQRAAVQMARAA